MKESAPTAMTKHRRSAPSELIVFGAERGMAKAVVAWMAAEGLLVRSEVRTPWGVCDLVGVRLNDHHVETRLRLGQREPVGSLRRAELLRHIPEVSTGRRIQLTTLIRRFQPHSTADEIESDIETLEARGFVASTKRGIQKLNGWLPLHDRVVAVELKLRRVQDALHQALANRAFSSEAYVALPILIAGRVASSARADAFRRLGIGLLGVDPSGTVRLIDARSTPARTSLATHCVEGFWLLFQRQNSMYCSAGRSG